MYYYCILFTNAFHDTQVYRTDKDKTEKKQLKVNKLYN